jgi:hypothetical protein
MGNSYPVFNPCCYPVFINCKCSSFFCGLLHHESGKVNPYYSVKPNGGLKVLPGSLILGVPYFWEYQPVPVTLE